MSEQFSSNIEKYRDPSISVCCENIAQIEELSWSDNYSVPIIYEMDIEGPINQVIVMLKGSSEKGGEFGFAAQLTLEDPIAGEDVEERTSAIVSLIGSFADKYYGINTSDNDKGYVVTYTDQDNDSFSFFVGLDSDNDSILIGTCRIDDIDNVNFDSAGDLRHGLDAFTPSFDAFCEILECFIQDFYKARGHNQDLVLNSLIHSFMPELEYHEEVDEEVVEPDEEVIDEQPYPLLHNIGGLESQKRELQEFIDELRYPEVLQAWGVERRGGLLLYGPSGTGKTMIVQSLANELDAELRTFSAADIHGMYVGDSEKGVKKIFSDASVVTEPTILYFNEIDGIISSKGENSNSTNLRAAAVFKQCAEDIVKTNPLVILVADTNHPDRIDDALLRAGRFDMRLHIPLPDLFGLAEIINDKIFRTVTTTDRDVFDVHGIEPKKLAQLCEGMSGTDIELIIKGMIIRKALEELRAGQTPDPIDQQQFMRSIQAYRTK